MASSRHQRVLSGMRATGLMHLGNYYGALKNWIALQHKYECFFFVADWHALTTHYESTAGLPSDIHNMVIDWLAAGLDPEISCIFLQSQVPQHAELFLLLSMITPLSWLERVPTYKDQQEKLKELDLSTYGFLGYPLLQSADILLYKANYVPVGEDQVAHIEITREIARRFNHIYGTELGKNILIEPQVLLTKASKMRGLDGQKMSKSYKNTINLRDEFSVIDEKIRRMPTDPARVRRSDPGEPTKCPVWNFHQMYSDNNTQEWVLQGCRSAGIGCLECKRPVIDAIEKEVAPIREKAQAYLAKPKLVQEIIQAGSKTAERIANETLAEVRTAMHLDYQDLIS